MTSRFAGKCQKDVERQYGLYVALTIEEALYELHLRLWNLTKDNLYRDASPVQKMAGMLTEHMNMQLLEVYRRAAEMRKHLA